METRPSTHRPLLITDDPELIDDVLHLAAAAAVDINIASHNEAGRALWASSPMVLVGGDSLGGLVRRPLARRRDVVVVLRQDPEDRDLDRVEWPSGPGQGAGPDYWRDAVSIGAEHVVVLPEAREWVVDRFCGVAEGPVRNGTVIAVLGASGGAGASTLSVAMALAARRDGRRSLLVDLDPYGGGLDIAMGSESIPGLRWPELMDAGGRLSAGNLDAALPHPHGVAVLSHARIQPSAPSHDSIISVIDAGVRGSDLVLLDHPRIGIPGEHVLDAPHAVVLVPSRIRSIAAAATCLPAARERFTEVHVVVRRLPRGIPTRDVERALGVTIAAEVPHDVRVAAAAEEGRPPSASDQVGRAAAALLSEIGIGSAVVA
jgi:secretion/DNA translocation related CpaE-like protein